MLIWRKQAERAESVGSSNLMPGWPRRSPKPPATSTNAASEATSSPVPQKLTHGVPARQTRSPRLVWHKYCWQTVKSAQILVNDLWLLHSKLLKFKIPGFTESQTWHTVPLSPASGMSQTIMQSVYNRYVVGLEPNLTWYKPQEELVRTQFISPFPCGAAELERLLSERGRRLAPLELGLTCSGRPIRTYMLEFCQLILCLIDGS